jgi:hypothetical protein
VGGAILIVVILLLFPILVGLGGLVLAAVLGIVADRDAAVRNAGTELADLS